MSGEADVPEADCDVLVVGARCAGSPLATMLARRGLRVCMVDRATFPSETPSTHVVQPSGVILLQQLGVLDQLWDAGAARLDRFILVIDDIRMSATVAEADFAQPGMCVRRVTLDSVLLDAAGEAGVDVRTGTNVTGLIEADGRVVGVETNGGPIRAKLVVGADGQHSRVAELVGAEEYEAIEPGRLFAWGYFRGVRAAPEIRLAKVGDDAYIATPTDGGLFLAGYVPSMEQKQAFLADRDARFDEGIAAWPELAGIVAGAMREGPLRIVSSWHSFFRRSAGPGWALVGDAGQFKDPTPGQGISDALRQAQRMADVVAPTIGDTVALDDALHRWWRWRDRDAREMYFFAAGMGAPGPLSPLRSSILGELAAATDTTNLFMRVLTHDIEPSKVFTPGRLARAVVRETRAGQRPTRAVLSEAAGLMADSVRQSRLRRPGGEGVRPTRRAAALRAFVSEKAAAPASHS